MEQIHKILIVEDDPFLLKIVVNRLKSDGFFVETATDGNEALVLLQKNKYALMLLDILMPEKNGISVLRDLKDQRIKTPPTIIFSNLSLGDIQEELEGLEVKGYFLKADHTIEEVSKMVSAYV